MGIACRGSVKAGCAAFVNPRTGFLMPVRFSVYGPRGLSCPLPSALAAALQDNARGCGTRCGLRGGGGRAQRAQRRGPPAPAFGLAGGGPKAPRPPNAAAPPGPRRSSPPLCQAYTLGKGRYPLLILLPSACPAPSRPPLPLRYRATPGAAVPAAASGGAAGARSAHKGGGLGPRLWFGGRGAKGPPAAKRRRPPGTYRGPLPLWFIPALFDPFHGYAPRSIGGAFLRQKQKGGIKAVFSLLQVNG